MTSPAARDPARPRDPAPGRAAFGALVAEPLFLLSDTAIVGHLGTAQLGGLGVAGQALTTIVYVCVFLAYGTTAGVARQVGAGTCGPRSGRASTACGSRSPSARHWSWRLAAGLLDRRRVRRVPGVAPHAETYLKISLLGIPGMLLVFAGTGVFAASRTRAPRSPFRSAASH